MPTSSGPTAGWPRPARTALAFVGFALAGVAAAALAELLHSSTAVTFGAVFVTASATAYLCQRGERRRTTALWATAHRDPLTGLPTRTVVERLLTEATNAGAALSVALADADNLKQVNATAGHAAGDQYLQRIAARLATVTPRDGILARFGGDEFVILAPAADPHELAAAITAAMTETVIVAGDPVPARASVGVAAGTDNARHILARADAALHTAKQTGDRVLVHDPDRDGTPRHDGTRPWNRRRDQRPHLPRGAPADTVTTPMECSRTDLTTILRALQIAHGWWAMVLDGTGIVRNGNATPAGDGARRQMAVYAELAARVGRIVEQNQR